MTEKEICQALCSLGGTSGFEYEAAEAVKNLLLTYMPVETDALGNVIGKINDKGKINVLLDAHLDRVGLVVCEIDDGGFLKVGKVGGIDIRTLIGAEVIVYGKQILHGVVCSTPPHLLTEADKAAGVDISKAAIDIGLTKQEAENLVSIGDRAIVTSGSSDLLGERFAAGALDNRSSIATVISAVSKISDKLKNVSLTVAFTSREEVGGSGAKTAAFASNADYAICVDVGFGSDYNLKNEQTIELAGGPSIGISPVLDRALMLELKAIAQNNSIPYQHDVMSSSTGTNADNIFNSKGGIKTALLSIPLRNMHTPVEVVDMKDITLTAELIAAFILKKESELNA